MYRSGWSGLSARTGAKHRLISVVLVLYLAELGLSDSKIGMLLTLTLLGDTAVSLWITTRADRVGRRRMLIVGALLMVLGGIALTPLIAYLLVANVFIYLNLRYEFFHSAR